MYRSLRAATLVITSAIMLAGVSASAPAHAKSSGEIAAVSKEMAVKYAECRQEANAQHLHLLARQRFLKGCHAKPQG